MNIKRIGLFIAENDSEAFMRTLRESLKEKLPDLETSLEHNKKTIYGLRTVITFEYTNDNFLKVTGYLDSNIKDILSIMPIE